MLIDWFTVGAQLLNFIILVYLMKRFLYQPVLDAIAAREAKIAAELADAAATKTKAHAQQREFEEKNQAFDEQRAGLLSKATEAANTERERLLAEARKTAEAASAALAKTLQADTQALHGEIVRQTQQQVFEIARRVMSDLADASLEQRACAVFIQRLQAVDGETWAALSTALKATSAEAPAMLRSAFDLPAEQLATIQAALDKTFGEAIALKVETAPGVVSGIELSAQGQKLAWSIAGYLTSLSATLNEHPAEAGAA
ncbi:MAG: F0F1 ATP synthase subunit delta [Gammaproteobacteria bacterium]|nr:F0F1 ATP synthase subunit delta [Gammaproteobacteria bacterium]MBU2154674.1 F0F1 ATP synthase subunit delta [Gammaproteobacteria bacterium]MBU2257148.1 F0F1 ATP synthase subunit delta [Gammaproteobacteria bacterium]MBU2293316.1 F0F1 ATP synthase subunit delta [Gammaproteobacteria bacterium]